MTRTPDEDSDGEVTSADPPEDLDPEAVTPHSSAGVSTVNAMSGDASGGSQNFLIVKDCEPWQEPANEEALDELGYTYTVIRSSQLADESLDAYTSVVIPSTQSSSYYETLADNQSKLANYVAQGGVLVAHVGDDGWPCTTQWSESFLPNDVQKTTSYDDSLTITETDHPIPADVDDDVIDDVGYSTHGYFDDVPDTGSVLFETDGRPSYIEYPYGAGLVVATMQTLEYQWGNYSSLASILRNEMEYATVGGGETTKTVEATYASLSYIPGVSENSTRGGNALNSSVADFFPGTIEFDFDIGGIDLGPLGEIDLDWDVLSVKATPPFDAWGTGDLIENSPPIDYADAIEPKSDKYEEFPGESFNRYRVRNELSIEFETQDGETIEDDSVSVTVDGEGGRTVLEQEDINTLDTDEIGAFEDGGNHYFPPGRRPRYHDERRVEFDGVEGVQVASIYGGYTQVAEKVAELAAEYDDLKLLNDVLGWEFTAGGEEITDAVSELPETVQSRVRPNFSKFVSMLGAVPNIYTFVEFTVLADGRETVRFWDASAFPQHALYLDGVRRDRTNLLYEPRELFNAHFMAFLAEAATRRVTPYYASERQYKEHVRNGAFIRAIVQNYTDFTAWIPDVDGDGVRDYRDVRPSPTEPLIKFGKDSNGAMNEDEIDGLLQSDPFFPF